MAFCGRRTKGDQRYLGEEYVMAGMDSVDDTRDVDDSAADPAGVLPEVDHARRCIGYPTLSIQRCPSPVMLTIQSCLHPRQLA